MFLAEILNEFISENINYFKQIQNNGKIDDLTRYDIKINPEFSVFTKSRKRRDIDIVVEISTSKSDAPLYSICIENKIHDYSIDKTGGQLNEELEGLRNYYEENKMQPEIYFIYLTPSPSDVSEQSFDRLKCDKKIHLFWDKKDESIVFKILRIFENEKNGVIDPITNQSIFLIKSFISFIRTGFRSYAEEKSEIMEKNDYGKPVIDHLNDFADRLDKKERYNLKFIREEFSKYIKEETGISLRITTRDAHIRAATVNEKSRIHYNVTKKDDDRKNIFFYPDIRNKKELALYDKDVNKDVIVEYKGRK